MDINTINFIGTSKFNLDTYKENIEFKKSHDKEKYCVVTLLNSIPSYIPTNAYIFILEMDNTNNKIIGIGIIKNFPRRCEDYGAKIYSNDYYNTYVYYGPHHISRDKILSNKENIKPLAYLENLVFKGKNHLKRGNNCFTLKNERILTTPSYNEFIFDKIWKWKNPIKDIRRCSQCHRVKDEKHRKLTKGKKCNLKPIFSYHKNKCDKCGKRKHGHICEKLKKHPENIDAVYTFLRSLFI